MQKDKQNKTLFRKYLYKLHVHDHGDYDLPHSVAIFRQNVLPKHAEFQYYRLFVSTKSFE